MPFTRLLFILCVLGPSCVAAGQNSGILMVKKGHHVVKRYFKGNNIEFFTKEGNRVEAEVARITADSLFLIYHDIRMMPTQFGTFQRDTLGSYSLDFSMSNIGSFPKPRGKGNVITSGTLFMIGGAAYTGINFFNTIREGDAPFGKDNLPKILAGIGTFGFGFMLSKLKKDRVYIGHKYTLSVVAP